MANTETTFTLKFKTENDEIIEKSVTTLKEVKQSVKDLESELEGTDFGSEQWQNLTTALSKSKTALTDISEAQKKAVTGTIDLTNTLKGAKQQVADLEAQLEETEFGSEKWEKLTGEIKTAKGELEEMTNAQQKATQTSKGLGATLSNLPGPIGGAIKGAQALNASLMKLVLNPIGAIITAIVLALTALYKAFTSTKAGGEQVERIMAGLGAVMDVLRDRVLKVGGAIVKFLTGDFSGAAEDLKGAFTGIGDEIAGEFNEAMRIKKELQEIDDATRELNNTRAEQNKLIAEAKLKINDESLSYEERKKALEEVRKSEIALAKQEEELAKRRYEAIKAQNALSDSSKEALEEEARAYQALQQASLASFQKQKELLDQEKALRDKQRAEQKARNDKYKADRKALQDFEQQLNLELIQDEKEKAIESANIAYQKSLTDIANLVTTTAKKNELREKAEKVHLQNIAKIEKDAAEKRRKDEEAAAKEADDKRKADEEKRKQDTANGIQREIKKIDTLMALDEMRYEDGKVRSEEELEYSISLLDQRLQAELLNTELSNEERLLLQQQYDKKALDLTKARTAQEREIERQKLQGLADGFQNIAFILGEQSAIGKAAAVASATINAYLSASEAYAATVGIPVFGPVLAPIAAAAAVAAGLKSVREILAVKEPDTTISKPKFAFGGMVNGQGNSDNVSALLTPGESIINATSTSAFPSLLSTINQLGGGRSFDSGAVLNSTTQDKSGALISALNGNGSQPVRAYVVSSEIETQAAFDRTVQSRSTL